MTDLAIWFSLVMLLFPESKDITSCYCICWSFLYIEAHHTVLLDWTDWKRCIHFSRIADGNNLSLLLRYPPYDNAKYQQLKPRQNWQWHVGPQKTGPAFPYKHSLSSFPPSTSKSHAQQNSKPWITPASAHMEMQVRWASHLGTVSRTLVLCTQATL